MIGRRKRDVPLTAEAHRRWLRAGRPPFKEFLAFSEDEQEALAAIGDEHTRDVAIAFALALRNPEAADMGARMEADEVTATDIAAAVAERVSVGPSFAGIHDRRGALDRADQRRRARTAFGKASDS